MLLAPCLPLLFSLLPSRIFCMEAENIQQNLSKNGKKRSSEEVEEKLWVYHHRWKGSDVETFFVDFPEKHNQRRNGTEAANKSKIFHFRILHLTDAHISIESSSPPYSDRMHSAFPNSLGKFKEIIEQNPSDLLLLGGDIFNFPCVKTVEKVLEILDKEKGRKNEKTRFFEEKTQQRREKTFAELETLNLKINRNSKTIEKKTKKCIKCLQSCDYVTALSNFSNSEKCERKDFLENNSTFSDFIFTPGNHDWLLEGAPGIKNYDHQKNIFSFSLKDLVFQSRFDRSNGKDAGASDFEDKFKILTVDNSDFQVSEEAFEFAREEIEEGGMPILLLLHIPLFLEGEQGEKEGSTFDLPPHLSCGHPLWGTKTDVNARIEKRPFWPENNFKSTHKFRDLILENAAPFGPIALVLSGHAHRDMVSSMCKGKGRGEGREGLVEPRLSSIASDCSWDHVCSLNKSASLGSAFGGLQLVTPPAAEGRFRRIDILIKEGDDR